MASPLKFGVLANPAGWHFRDLLRAANERFRLAPVQYSRLATSLSNSNQEFVSSAQNLLDFDALLIRAMPTGSLSQVVLRMDLLQQLHESGLPMINRPKTIEASVDKYLSLAKLRRAQIPIPQTAACQSTEEAIQMFDQLGGDVVVKPMFGSQGRGLERVTTRKEAETCFNRIAESHEVIYFQRFLNHGGRDLRLLVIGGEVIGMARENATHWVTNVSCGGTPSAYQPTHTETELALAAARAVGGEFVGVDLIYENHQPYLVDINSSPGWSAISQVNQVDVASRLLDLLARISQA